jgi:hypothetical protein
MIRIRCQTELPLCRYEMDDYVRGLDLTVVGYTEHGEEIVLGRIEADLLLMREATDDNQPLVQICDSYSSELIDLFIFLFEENGFMEEISADENTDHVLFVWRAAFHPSVRKFQSNIVNSLPNLVGNDCAVVMQRNVAELNERELIDLGFSKLAGTDYVFRHASYLNEFMRVHPRGMEETLTYVANEEFADWIDENWD